MAQATAAFFIALHKLRADGHAFIATITFAAPDHAARFAALIGWGETDKSTETHIGEILLAGRNLRNAATVMNGTTF